MFSFYLTRVSNHCHRTDTMTTSSILLFHRYGNFHDNYHHYHSIGRVTAFLRGSSFEPFLVELQRLWMPLVYAIFPTEQFYGGKAVEQLKAAGGKLHDWKAEFEGDDDEQKPTECQVDEIPTKRYIDSIHQTKASIEKIGSFFSFSWWLLFSSFSLPINFFFLMNFFIPMQVIYRCNPVGLPGQECSRRRLRSRQCVRSTIQR